MKTKTVLIRCEVLENYKPAENILLKRINFNGKDNSEIFVDAEIIEPQAFIDQLCKEYRESILNQVEQDAKADNLGTLESIFISIGNAKQP